MRFAIAAILLVVLHAPASKQAVGQDILWEFADGPYGGEVNALAAAPNGAIYAATPSGLFRTDDQATLWEPVDTGYPNTRVMHAVATPNGELIILAHGTGILRSTDDGATWESLEDGLPPGADVAVLANGPSGDVYVGLEDTAGGLYRIQSGETTWQNAGLPSPSVTAIAYGPDGTILVGRDEAANTCDLCTTLYRSDDGSTWSEVTVDSHRVSVQSIAFHPDGSAFFGGFSPHGDFAVGSGVFRSDDGGVSWSRLTEHPDAWIKSLFVDAAGLVVYASGEFEGLGTSARSPDLGETWGPGVDQATVSVFAEDATGRLYVGTNQIGVLRSEDNGDTWTETSEGLGRAPVSHIEILPNGVRYAAGHRLYRFDDEGWSRVSYPGEPVLFLDALSAKSDGTVFIAEHDVILRSDDRGTWDHVSQGAAVRKLLIGQADELFAGTREGIYRSRDNGDDWTFLEGSPPGVLDLARNANGHLFATTGNENVGQVFRSTDGGETWRLVGSWGIRASAVGISPTGTVFASSLQGGVRRSSDNGETWDQIDIGLIEPHKEVETFAFSEEGAVFAGTGDDILVVWSDDDGLTWQPAGDGIDASIVHSMAVDADNFVYAAVWNGGLLRSQHPVRVSVEDAADLPEQTLLLQNYPNPFASSTKIHFALEGPADVSLEVFDLLGRHVESLVTGQLPAGPYAIDWKADHIPEGVYIYRLTTGGRVEAKTMTLVR